MYYLFITKQFNRTFVARKQFSFWPEPRVDVLSEKNSIPLDSGILSYFGSELNTQNLQFFS